MAKHSRERDEWGSIQYAYDGNQQHHRIRYWAKDPKTGLYRRMSKTVRGTKRQAQEERARLRVEHSGDAPCPTVRQAWEMWALPMWERMVADGEYSRTSLGTRMSAWRSHVGPRWGDVPCDSVKPLDVQQWLNTRAYTAASNSLAVMRWVFRWATTYGAVERNPMREEYVLPPKSTVRAQRSGVWSAEELAAIWRALRGTWMEPAFIVSAYGSCRPAESLGVTDSDVRGFSHAGVTCALVSVERQVDTHGKVMDRLKTPESRRVTAVPGAAGGRLLELASSCDGFLTNDGRGGTVKGQTYQRNFELSVRDAGLHVAPPRNLRTSWRTIVRYGMRLDDHIAELLMGHVTRTVTNMHYDRATPEEVAAIFCEAYAANPVFDSALGQIGTNC